MSKSEWQNTANASNGPVLETVADHCRQYERTKSVARLSQTPRPTRNESVPKIITNNSINSFLKLQSAFGDKFQTTTVSECCLIKLLQYIII